jgi:hypothetical protein
MHKKIIQLFIIIQILFPFSAYSNDKLCLNTGDYISEEFCEKVQNGLSLKKATYGLKFIFASVFQKENSVSIGLNNFYDSVFLNILPDCNTIKDVEKYPKDYTFERIDKDRFEIYTANQNLIFKNVGNDRLDWLAIQIFSGKWNDDNGNEFIFYQNSEVSINNEIANYTIGNKIIGDKIGIVIDIVKLGNSNYAFKILNNKLFLYEATVSDISEEPNYILKLIKKYH